MIAPTEKEAPPPARDDAKTNPELPGHSHTDSAPSRSEHKRTLPLDAIRPCPANRVIYRPPCAGLEFEELVQSIQENGVLHPVIVDAEFVLLSGHRRTEAAKAAGLAEIPVEIREDVFMDELDEDEQVKVLAEFNRGTRRKTAEEEIREALASVDADEAVIRAREYQQRGEVLNKVKTWEVTSPSRSSRTDPTKSRREFFDAVVEILKTLNQQGMLPVEGRVIHYRLLNKRPMTSAGRKGHPYGTKNTDDSLLSKLLTDARSAGMIPHEWFNDETRPNTTWRAESLGEFVRRECEGFLRGFQSDIHAEQPHHVEIFVEKSTIYPLVKRKVASELRLPITSCRGYMSQPTVAALVDRFIASGKDALAVVYASDWDPEGLDMLNSFIKYMSIDFGVTPIVYRAAVTREQIEKYNLHPDAQAKTGSARYKRFVAEHGTDCFELDSLDPSALCDEVRKTCERALDMEVFDAAIRAEEANFVTLEALASIARKAIAEHLEAIE